MRTVDPEIWNIKSVEPHNARKIFGIQSVTALENKLRTSFRGTVMDFWSNCSIEWIKYIRERNLQSMVRRCYVAFIVVLTVGGMVALSRSWRAFSGVPLLVVTLLTSQHPVRHVDFPAVAICTNHAVSRSALEQYAKYLYSLDVNGTYALKDIQRNLLSFGSLVQGSGPPMDASFLEYTARMAHETNVTNIILNLTPQCSSLLVRCAWRAARVPCERLFALRATPFGFCCVFNSRYQDEDLHKPARRLHFMGPETGLSLVVRENDDDAALVQGPHDGLQVIIFEGSEYPLIEGGSSKVYPLQRDTSAYMKISTTAQFTAPYLNYYSEEWLGCRIRHPQSLAVDRRSHTWCLAGCRRRAVRALCGCVPPLLFPRPGDTVCSPDRLACLDKHREKFTNFYPGDFAHSSLNEEAADSMDCNHCLPDCARLLFRATVCLARHQFADKLFSNFFISGLSPINTSIVHIYYASEDHKLYIVEANRAWYEIAAFLGSQWLCVVAVTLVSAMEMVYHATIGWGHHYRITTRGAARHATSNSRRLLTDNNTGGCK